VLLEYEKPGNISAILKVITLLCLLLIVFSCGDQGNTVESEYEHMADSSSLFGVFEQGFKQAGRADIYGQIVPALERILRDTGESESLLAPIHHLNADANEDGIVDILDIILVAKHFGMHDGDSLYDAKCDLNTDGKIDLLDLIVVAQYLGVKEQVPLTVDEVDYPFHGIKRTHRITRIPRFLNINILEVTLADPGISLFVSPGDSAPQSILCEEAIVRRTTTFVAEFGLQVGINGDFSDPNCNSSRTEGEAAGVHGLGVSYRKEMPDRGLSEIPRSQYSPHNSKPALAFTESKQAYIGWYAEDDPFPLEVYNAVGGNKMLVEDGQPVDPGTWDPMGKALELHPRTSVGLSSDGGKLIIIVVDGRQAGYSEGVTLPEMSEYLMEFGTHTGLNFDGGGSSTMVFGTPSGPEIINNPSDGAERARPNHLGIYATPAIWGITLSRAEHAFPIARPHYRTPWRFSARDHLSFPTTDSVLP